VASPNRRFCDLWVSDATVLDCDCALMRTIRNKWRENERRGTGGVGRRNVYCDILQSHLYSQACSASFARGLPQPPIYHLKSGSPCDLVFLHQFLANKPATMPCLSPFSLSLALSLRASLANCRPLSLFAVGVQLIGD